MNHKYRRRDPRPLAAAAIAGLWVLLVLESMSAVLGAFELDVYGRLADDAYRSSDDIVLSLVTMVGVVRFIAFVVVALLFFRWTYCVNANAQRLAEGMTITPAGAVGWYFVPIANFWKPFAGLDQAWRVSHDPDNWRDTPSPEILKVWWGLWIAANVTCSVANYLAKSAQTPDLLVNSAWIGLLSSVLWIWLDLHLISVIRQLTKMQVDTMHARPISQEAGPPSAT